MPEHQQTQQSTESKSTAQKQATPMSQTPVSNPYSIIQRAKVNPRSLTRADIMQLQRTIGNQAVGRLLSSIGNSSTAQQATVQRQEIPEEEKACPSCMQRQEISEEEEPLQGKMIGIIQRQEIPEEEEPLQGKFENNPEIACSSCFATPIVQRQEIPEEEEPLQGKFESIQHQEIPIEEPLQTKKENNTGMPDNLKAGVESLSGIDMSDVRVHYNSDKPAEVGALAYTQGTNIHVAPGQERHLPHEAWHVVQQAQGRVQATTQMKGLGINDDPSLEHEADKMGAKTMQLNALAYAQRTDIHFGDTLVSQCMRINLAHDKSVNALAGLQIPGEKPEENRRPLSRFHTDMLQPDEDLIIEGHGTFATHGIVASATGFAERSPEEIANEVIRRAPVNWIGRLILVGCNTADIADNVMRILVIHPNTKSCTGVNGTRGILHSRSNTQGNVTYGVEAPAQNQEEIALYMAYRMASNCFDTLVDLNNSTPNDTSPLSQPTLVLVQAMEDTLTVAETAITPLIAAGAALQAGTRGNAETGAVLAQITHTRNLLRNNVLNAPAPINNQLRIQASAVFHAWTNVLYDLMQVTMKQYSPFSSKATTWTIPKDVGGNKSPIKTD